MLYHSHTARKFPGWTEENLKESYKIQYMGLRFEPNMKEVLHDDIQPVIIFPFLFCGLSM
jgi:hypothetical protein